MNMLLWLALGCVAKKDYVALEGSLADVSAQLEAEQARTATLEEELAAERARAAELEARVGELEARIGELTDEKARMLKDQSSLKSAIEEMEQALAELQARKAAADARIQAFQDLLDRFQSLIDAGTLKVRIIDGRMVVELATDVLFASGSAALSKDGEAAVVQVTEVLVTIPDRDFQVAGHTDNVPIATAQYPSNWELAAARAITVVRAMTGAGLPAERVSAASYGEFQPSASNDTTEGKAANRRIEIVVVPDLSSLPGYDELQAISEGRPVEPKRPARKKRP